MFNKTLSTAIVSISLSFAPLISYASSWTLDKEESSISFVSTKNDSVAEAHVFNDFSGRIENDTATVTILPDSVDTGIGIRNDRMREFLFETGVFPKITISAWAGSLEDLPTNMATKIKVPATLSLHGVSKKIIMDVTVLKTSDQSITINSQKPVIINAEDYNLNEGIIKLSNLVGDIPITKAVPTYFSLVFKNS